MADDQNPKFQKLQELALKKRLEREEEERQQKEKGASNHAAQLIDFGDDSESDEERNETVHRSGGGGRPAVQGDDDRGNVAVGEAVQSPDKRRVNDGEGEDDDEEEENDLVPSAADLDFIDDEGVAPEERVDFGEEDDEGEPLTYEEAEEAKEDMEDELERIFGKRKRQEVGQDAADRATVENLLAQMEVAVEEDIQAHEAGKPAIHRLRMLSRVQDVLSKRKLHNDLLDSGLLGVLKAWIEPMPDGTLPNTRLRNSVLNMLGALPIDCSFEDRREQLKRSGLGKVVMFLSKLPDETTENKRLAHSLVERWSRPILASARTSAHDETELERMRDARQQRQRAAREGKTSKDADIELDGMVPLNQQPGQPGFRYHATVPEAAALDYVKRPNSKVKMVEKRTGGKVGEHKLTKKLKSMGKKSMSQAANVSVEGRNVTLQH